MTTMTSKPILEMSFTELETWWHDYRERQKSWGGILEHPYPKLLTTWYAERLVDGDILASKENIQSAKRHLRDLERQGTEEFPWVFVEEKGHRPIRFIEKKCSPSKGDSNKLVMQPWQHFVIGSLFGWVHKDTGIRRFREGLVFVSRKNGKTTLISGVANYMLGFDDERGANIYVLANSQKQSTILFDESKAMIKSSPYLDKRYKALRTEIRYEKMNCTMVAMSAEKSDKDGENLHFGVFDELHEYKDYGLINVMKKSRGMRTQPLILYITTAGYVLDGPLMQYYENGQDTLDNLEDDIDERTFYFLAKLDNPEEADDPRMWIKANPNIGLMDFINLVTDWKKDRVNPQEKADWLTKQFNLFSDVGELSFVDIPTIKKNNKEIDIKELEGKSCVGSYDLSETEDFTAAALEFPLENGEVFVLQHTFIPQARRDRDPNPQRIDEWEKAGELTIIPGDYVKHEYVYEWFVEQSEKYVIELIAYDPAKALYLNKSLENHGFVTEKVRQGFITLGGPMQNFKELMLDGKVVFNNSKIFRWYLSNIKLVKDRNSNWMPSKQSVNRKIDGFAAALNAHVHVMDRLSEPTGDGNVEFMSISDLLGG